MIIDCHAHLVPPALLPELLARAGEFPDVRLFEEAGSVGFSFAGGKPTRPVARGLTDVAARVAWMDKNGIDLQVVAGWVDMFGYELPTAQGVAWARAANQAMAQFALENPRFLPLASIPMQDGGAAAEVLTEAMAAGFRGAMIGTQPNGRGSVLDDPSLNPFWEAADRTGAVLIVHPVFDSGDSRNEDYGMPNAVGRITDTLIAVSRLLYAGHVQRYAGMKFVAPIGGAALPFILGRLKRNASLDAKLADPEDGLRRMWYDTLLHDPRTLRFVAEIVGEDRLMLGSDAPFPIGDLTPRAILREAGFGGSSLAAMEGGTAAALFGIADR